jgi:hypothetical protein
VDPDLDGDDYDDKYDHLAEEEEITVGSCGYAT